MDIFDLQSFAKVSLLASFVMSGSASTANASNTLSSNNALRPTQYLIAQGDLNGTWRTTEGTMIINQEASAAGFFDGSYSKRGGKIYDGGVGFDGKARGYWVQNYSDRRCSTSQYGSYYWGRFTFSFSSSDFTGSYTYCNGKTQYPWNGNR